METQTKQKERMMKTERKTRTISEKRKKKEYLIETERQTKRKNVEIKGIDDNKPRMKYRSENGESQKIGTNKYEKKIEEMGENEEVN